MKNNFISSFHFIIEDLFKNEYPLLWNNVRIQTYWTFIDEITEEARATEINGKYLISNNELVPEEKIKQNEENSNELLRSPRDAFASASSS